MQVLCDSIGEDFPRFPQFVAMLREYEHQLGADAAIRRQLRQAQAVAQLPKHVQTVTANFLEYEQVEHVKRRRGSRCVMVLPNGSRFYVPSLEAGMAAIKSNEEQGYRDFHGAHFETEPCR